MMLSFVRWGQTGRRAEAHLVDGNWRVPDVRQVHRIGQANREYQRQIRSTHDMREVERLQAQVRELISQKISFHSTPAS
jgi:hypothetical protein